MPPPIEKPLPRRLDNLAVEIQLQILSNLPPRQILFCRGVSRHFRNVIDLEENHGILVGGSISASLDRLHCFVERYCDFPLESDDGGPDAFLHAVLDFIRLRRLSTGADWRDDLDLFVEFWFERSGGPFYDMPFDVVFVGGCTDEFLEICDQATYMMSYTSGSYFYVTYGQNMEAMYSRTKDLLREVESRSIGDVLALPMMEEKQTILADLALIDQRSGHMEVLRRIIGVPTFSAMSPYAYRLSSSWPIAKLQVAIDHSKELKGIERAMVLEEVHIA
ncbi:hypothetical protein CBER1_10797 [Cercospora berteroae]|uniref:F-box domain-containing protein n=1 Tax=Cercospora berteroae TaxID=357750 RepID=A0A2S6BZ30_9PEZI|nr:hypothetical protein CBER1_10797 [Cercospora berteroae]